MNLRPWTASLAVCAVVIAGAASGQTPAAKPQYGTYGFDAAGMDAAVAPGNDFFSYANGGWLKATPIPDDKASVNTFGVLRDKASERTAALIDTASKSNAAAGSEARKIGDYYASYMDAAAIEKLGAAPLKPQLAAIASIRTRHDLATVLGAGLRADVDALNATNFHTDRLLGLWVAEDLNDTTLYRPYLMQGGLWLPDREYYLGQDARYVELRAKYRTHIANMLRLAGLNDVETRAGRVLALETAMAAAHWSVEQSNDVLKANTVWSRAQMASQAPGLDWDAFLKAAGLGEQNRFGAWQASAIAGLSKLTTSESLDTWRDYLAFHAAARGAPFLSKAFVDESFAFNGLALSGTPAQRDRWKRGVDVTSAALGEAIGKLYVDKYFSPAAKAQVETMVQNILAALGPRIDGLDWMTPATKAEAKKKLANFQVGVGYPDKWLDYSALRVVRGDAFGNNERAELFEYRRNLAKLGKPVDRHEWFMTPQTVNALFAPSQNSIIFPAAILEPTFFDPAADPAVNYGAIGSVIGHEISHSFDTTGSAFDAHGNLRNWWTDADLAQFKARATRLAQQFSSYEALPGLHVNGDQVIGEGLADLAGINIAHDAYVLSLGGKPAPVIDGMTGDQRFFLGFAQNYRGKSREAAMRRTVVTDVHPPGPVRAQTVRNLDAWYAAFKVEPGQALYLAPDQRVKIW
jgi:putative endopeptidase